MAEPTAPSGPAYLKLVLLGAVVGIPAALAAALFLALVHELQHWIWVDLPEALGHSAPPWYLLLGLPVVGAGLVVIARLLLPGDGGHLPLEGLSAKPTMPRFVPGVVLAALGSLGFGAVLGPEAPVLALGSAIGAAASRLGPKGPHSMPILANAGSFSAISALFGGPIVAGMLLVEGGVGLGAALLPALLPGLVAAAVGYLVFIGFGEWGGLDAPGLVVPDLPAYEGMRIGDMGVAIVVGVLAALVIAAVRAGGHRVDALRARTGVAGPLLAGGLVVGLLALLGRLLGADSQDVLFSGQTSIPVLVTTNSATLVVVLLATKFLGYAVSLGCGFRGGPIFPAIFLGIAVASLAVVWLDISPTLAVAVGAAAGMAAQTRLLFSPLILGTLLVGRSGADTVSATALGTAAAWLVTTMLDRRAADSKAAAAGA